MEKNQKTMILVIVMVMVVFIAGIGVLAIYSSFEDSSRAEQPTVVINNYELQQPAAQAPERQQPRSSLYQQQSSIPERPTQNTYNYYSGSSYSPIYSYYPHYQRSYYPYPRYYPYPLYASDAYVPSYDPYFTAKRIYY